MAGIAESGPSTSLLPHMNRRWKSVGRKLAFTAKDQAQWRRWHKALIRKLKELTGYDTMSRAPLRPRITEEVDLGDHRRQRVEITTEPGVVMPLYVLMPAQGSKPWAPVIAAHGHVSGGKTAVAGCRELPEIAQTIEQHHYDYGLQLVRAGFMVFCPDARGFGERQEPLVRGNPLGASCQWLSNMAVPLGQTVTGMWTWELHRLLDYVQTRPECRGQRIGCVGLSGGGLQTLWASALDERIACAVVSGYFYGYRQSLLEQHTNCACNYVPHLYEYADMGDIGALLAPRALLIETGNRDSLNGAGGLRNVISQVAVARKAYRLLGAGRRLKHVVFDGEHRWHGVDVAPWLKRWLMIQSTHSDP